MRATADRFTCPAGLHERGQKFVATKPCTACRATEDLAADAEFLHTLEPSLDRDTAVAVIETVTSTRQHRGELHTWLRHEPDPLHSGTSSAPKVAQRLLAELDRRGVPVALPHCLHCRRAKTLVAVVEGGRVCFNCYHYDRAEPCARCGRSRPVCAREADGRAVCQRCRAADPDSWRPCGRCGTTAPTVAMADGVRVGRCCYVPPGLRCSVCGQAKGERPYRTRRPVCAGCAARPRVACIDCGLDAAVRDDDGDPRCERCQRGATETCGCGAPTVGRAADGSARCSDCYERPVRACGRCGRLRVIVRLAVGGEPELCGLCWRGPVVTCEGCGNRRACRGERTGVMLCASCQWGQRGERQICSFCGRTRRVVAHWPDGPVCPSCYPHHRSTRGDCSRCGQRRRLLRHTRGAPACAACLGVADSGVCRSCGADDEPLWDRGRCPRCTLAGRLPMLLGDDASRTANGLDDLYDALLAAPSARAVLDWLRRSDATDLLARIARGDLARTHAALDTLAPSGTVEHLRHLLVAIAALPPRDPALAALDRWIDGFLDGVTDPDHAALLRPYARWRILRPVRAKAEQGPVSDGTAYGARSRLRAAATFLAFLADRGRAPGDCRQVDVDAWLTEHPDHHTGPARPFATWAMDRQAMPRLDYPPRGGTRGGTVTIADDERWVVARRLLQDPGIDIADRVAGALVVIYAQPLARITRLTIDDVTIEPDRVSLRLGRSAIELPYPLDDHLRQLVAHPPHPSTVRLPAARWLFPSRTAKGRPTGALTIGKRLSRLGVVASQFRQAALFQLCAELPAAVVADILGISINTAELWARLAGREQADYMQLRGAGRR